MQSARNLVQNSLVQEPNEDPRVDGKDEGYYFALALGIGLTIFWGPLLGFYTGTVVGNRTHEFDLRQVDMVNGGYGALIGMALGLASLVYILAVYPSRTKKDLADWKEEYSHPHFSDDHH